MFADPLVLPDAIAMTHATLVAGGTSWTFAATGRGPLSSTYRLNISSTHYIDLFIGRQVGKRTRSTVRLTETELVPDPMNSELNVQKTSTCYVVCDRGPLGDGTYQDLMEGVLGLFCLKSTDTAQLLVRVRNGET